jgi:hypothetical protein
MLASIDKDTFMMIGDVYDAHEHIRRILFAFVFATITRIETELIKKLFQTNFHNIFQEHDVDYLIMRNMRLLSVRNACL